MAVYNYTKKDDSLEYLKNMESQKVEWNEPDIRGWSVVAADGKDIGKVHDLVVRKDNKKVVYIDIHLPTEMTEGENDHAMIPAGFIDVEDDNEKVRIALIKSGHSEMIPKYRGGTIYKDYEEEMSAIINTIMQKERPHRRYEEHELYTDDRLHDRRNRRDVQISPTTTPTRRH
ncbi:MAG: PRC-barrel domain-containing protein [Candidatus Kapaibacterium sp.]